MAITTLGIFHDLATAQRAMETLRDSALELEDISVISRATESGGVVSDSDHLTAGEGATVGAVWGGLVGLAALLIPGIGPFVAGGALFAALTGAATGAVVGGIAGALTDRLGISAEEARQYEELVETGKTLIAVKSNDSDANEVRRMLVQAGADELHDSTVAPMTATDAPKAAPTGIESTGRGVHVAMYDSTGKRVDLDRDTNQPTVVDTQPPIRPV